MGFAERTLLSVIIAMCNFFTVQHLTTHLKAG